MRVVLLGPPPAVQTAKAERISTWMLKKQHAVTSAVGVRRVIDAIVAANVPIVGHNCYLDLMHVYAKFIADPPPLLGDWCCRMHENFPVIFDTKHLLTGAQLRELVPDSTLDVAHAKLEDLAAAAVINAASSEAALESGKSSAKSCALPTVRRSALGADGAASAAHEAGDADLSACIHGNV
jgi:poly(A)-specific ribonuclease